MKYLLLVSLIAGGAGTAQAATLFNNGPAIDGGSALSVVREGGVLFGVPAMSGPGRNFSVADNFTVTGAGWVVQDLTFFAYQIDGGGGFGFGDVTWSVVSGDANTGAVLASGITSVRSGGLLGYRVESANLQDTTRPVLQLNADVPDFNLVSGSYWLRWSFSYSGVPLDLYQPPVASGATGNALRRGGTSNFYVWAIDPGDSLGMELPFMINGTLIPIPEPSTYTMMLAGVLGVVGFIRHRRKDLPDLK